MSHKMDRRSSFDTLWCVLHLCRKQMMPCIHNNLKSHNIFIQLLYRKTVHHESRIVVKLTVELLREDILLNISNLHDIHKLIKGTIFTTA